MMKIVISFYCLQKQLIITFFSFSSIFENGLLNTFNFIKVLPQICKQKIYIIDEHFSFSLVSFSLQVVNN